MLRAAARSPMCLLLLLACGGDTAVEPPIPPITEPVSIRLDAVDPLVPGTQARLHGTGLLGLEKLWVDNVLIGDVTRVSDVLATFTVPHIRECETDSRPVLVAAQHAAAPLEARIEVAASVSLAVGHSRALGSAELACLRLPGRDEDYVLSVANTELPAGTVESPRMLLSVRTLPSHPTTAATFNREARSRSRREPTFATRASGSRFTSMSMIQHATASHGSAGFDATSPGALTARTPTSVAASAEPVQFDPRYAVAMPGDTVTMVAWPTTSPASVQICALPRAAVPTFPALVIGVSGMIVAAVDLRVAPAPDVIARARHGWLNRALDMSAPVLLPAMRSIFDPGYQPFAGGGGRYYVLFTDRAAGYALDGAPPGATGWFQADCPHASEMTTMSAPVSMLDAATRDATLTAKFFIHEYAHTADMITVSRRGYRTASGLWAEAFAVLAEETAARISSGQPEAARLSRLGDDHPWAGNAIDVAFWGRDAHRGPWQMNGRYSTAATMLLFLRELAGEVTPEHGRSPTLFQRLIHGADNFMDPLANIARVNTALGIDYVELTDRWMLASVTAGLLPSAVADAAQLPRFRSWDAADWVAEFGPGAAGFPTTVDRGAARAWTLSAAAGAHAALFLPGAESRGMSLRLLEDSGRDRIVRLTRVR